MYCYNWWHLRVVYILRLKLQNWNGPIYSSQTVATSIDVAIIITCFGTV